MRNIQTSQTAFDQQVTEAVAALQNTSALVATLQQGVTERMARLEELKKEHDKYSQLAQIEAKQAEALLEQVKDTLGKEQTKEKVDRSGNAFRRWDRFFRGGGSSKRPLQSVL